MSTNKPDPVDPVDELARRIAEAITCICGAGIEGHRRACIVNHREDVRRIAARVLREASWNDRYSDPEWIKQRFGTRPSDQADR